MAPGVNSIGKGTNSQLSKVIVTYMQKGLLHSSCFLPRSYTSNKNSGRLFLYRTTYFDPTHHLIVRIKWGFLPDLYEQKSPLIH